MMIPLIFALILVLFTKANGEVNSQNLELNQILKEELETYPSLKLFPKYSEQPVHVDVELNIREILDISEVNLDMKLNLILNIAWKDEALSYEYTFPGDSNSGVWVGDSVVSKIWTPPVSILNEKDSAQQSSNAYKPESIFWSPDGSLLRKINLITTVSCAMSLETFPMDEKICSILIGSLTHTDRSIELSIKPSLDPIFHRFVKNFELLGMRVSPIVQSNSMDYQTTHSYELLLRRHLGYYVIRTYFPSALIVVLSWIVFWMARDAAAARTALGVTCVLATLALLISSQASSPKVSCVKAMDIYLGACLILVFASLLQSHTVSYLLHKVRRSDKVQEASGENLLEGQNVECPPSHRLDSVFLRVISGRLETTEEAKVGKLVARFDVWSRVIFPLIFLTFNVVYWTFYLTGSKFDVDKGWELPESD